MIFPYLSVENDGMYSLVAYLSYIVGQYCDKDKDGILFSANA